MFCNNKICNYYILSICKGTRNDQEQLARGAQQTVRMITGPSSLGSEQSSSQVMLVQSAKEVLSSLIRVVDSAKNAYGKPLDDPSIKTLKELADGEFKYSIGFMLEAAANIDSQMNTGLGVLQSAIKGIQYDIKVLFFTFAQNFASSLTLTLEINSRI